MLRAVLRVFRDDVLACRREHGLLYELELMGGPGGHI